MFKAFWMWLRDFPRPCWMFDDEEQTYAIGPRWLAEVAAREHRKEAAVEGYGPGRVYRGDWLRPSEIESLPEY